MKKYVIGFLVILGCLGIGVAVGRYASPTKVETIEVVKEKIVEKVVEKIVYKEGIKKQTKTIITEKPDGTKITEIFEVFESTIFIESKRETELLAEIETLKKQLIENGKPQWKLAAGYKFNPEAYMIEVDRRIIGPFFLGVNGDSNRQLGLTIGMEF